MANLNAQCAKTFKHYVEVTSVGQNLTEADKKEMKDKGMNKMLKECCGEAAAKVSESSIFPKYCDRRTKKLKLDIFLGDFLTELAAAVIQSQKKLTKRPALDDPDVGALSTELRTQIAAKSEVKKKEVKVDAVTARLTDTKGYTGTHKERFDEQGKGKGIAGRKEIADKSGYVTGFKGHQEQEGAGTAGK